MDSDKAQFNKPNDLTNEPQKQEELSWVIVARFIHIMYTFYLREKANVPEAAIFTW